MYSGLGASHITSETYVFILSHRILMRNNRTVKLHYSMDVSLQFNA